MPAQEEIGLVIETAIGTGADLGLCRQGHLEKSCGLEPGERSAQGLIPATHKLLSASQVSPSELRFLGLTIGPGSFTGLRVGVTFAKILGYALRCRIVPINTFDVWARQIYLELQEGRWKPFQRMVILYDAQRGEFFSQYRSGHAESRPADLASPPIEIQKPESMLESLRPGDLLTGTGVLKLKEAQCQELDRRGVQIAAPTDRVSTLAALAAETWEALEAGAEVDPFKLMPRYYRESAAEEKRRANQEQVPGEAERKLP